MDGIHQRLVEVRLQDRHRQHDDPGIAAVHPSLGRGQGIRQPHAGPAGSVDPSRHCSASGASVASESGSPAAVLKCSCTSSARHRQGNPHDCRRRTAASPSRSRSWCAGTDRAPVSGAHSRASSGCRPQHCIKCCKAVTYIAAMASSSCRSQLHPGRPIRSRRRSTAQANGKPPSPVPSRAARPRRAPPAGHRSAGHIPRRPPPASHATAARFGRRHRAAGSAHGSRAIASWQASTSPRPIAEGVTIGACPPRWRRPTRGRISPSGRPGVRVTAPQRKHLMRMARKFAGQIALDQHRRPQRHIRSPVPAPLNTGASPTWMKCGASRVRCDR